MPKNSEIKMRNQMMAFSMHENIGEYIMHKIVDSNRFAYINRKQTIWLKKQGKILNYYVIDMNKNMCIMWKYFSYRESILVNVSDNFMKDLKAWQRKIYMISSKDSQI